MTGKHAKPDDGEQVLIVTTYADGSMNCSHRLTPDALVAVLRDALDQAENRLVVTPEQVDLITGGEPVTDYCVRCANTLTSAERDACPCPKDGLVRITGGGPAAAPEAANEGWPCMAFAPDKSCVAGRNPKPPGTPTMPLR